MTVDTSQTQINAWLSTGQTIAESMEAEATRLRDRAAELTKLSKRVRRALPQQKRGARQATDTPGPQP